jgi:hypothetical protein
VLTQYLAGLRKEAETMLEFLPSRSLLAALRIIAIVHLAVLAVQPVLAGQIFSGRPDALAFHSTVGETVAWLGLLQALMALLCWLRNGVSVWFAAASLVIFGLDGLQVHLGHAKVLSAHVPLGASLLALSLAMTLSLWRGPYLRGANETPAGMIGRR